MLPLAEYRALLVGGPYAFLVTSQGCPGGWCFCVKHVSHGGTVRPRSPESMLAEIEQLVGLGVHVILMHADLLTVNREQLMGICEACLKKKG